MFDSNINHFFKFLIHTLLTIIAINYHYTTSSKVHLVSYTETITKSQLIQLRTTVNHLHLASFRVWTKDDLLSTGHWYSKFGSKFMDLNREGAEKGPKLIGALLKPIMLLDALRRSDAGDLIVYSDIEYFTLHPLIASHNFQEILVSTLSPLLNHNNLHQCACIPGILLPTSTPIGHDFEKYTKTISKGNIFGALSLLSIPEYCQSQYQWAHKHNTVDTSWSVWKNTFQTQLFVSNWLELLSHSRLLYLIPIFSLDGTVLSLLLAKYHIKALFMPELITWPTLNIQHSGEIKAKAPPGHHSSSHSSSAAHHVSPGHHPSTHSSSGVHHTSTGHGPPSHTVSAGAASAKHLHPSASAASSASSSSASNNIDYSAYFQDAYMTTIHRNASASGSHYSHGFLRHRSHNPPHAARPHYVYPNHKIDPSTSHVGSFIDPIHPIMYTACGMPFSNHPLVLERHHGDQSVSKSDASASNFTSSVLVSSQPSLKAAICLVGMPASPSTNVPKSWQSHVHNQINTDYFVVSPAWPQFGWIEAKAYISDPIDERAILDHLRWNWTTTVITKGEYLSGLPGFAEGKGGKLLIERYLCHQLISTYETQIRRGHMYDFVGIGRIDLFWKDDHPTIKPKEKIEKIEESLISLNISNTNAATSGDANITYDGTNITNDDRNITSDGNLATPTLLTNNTEPSATKEKGLSVGVGPGAEEEFNEEDLDYEDFIFRLFGLQGCFLPCTASPLGSTGSSNNATAATTTSSICGDYIFCSRNYLSSITTHPLSLLPIHTKDLKEISESFHLVFNESSQQYEKNTFTRPGAQHKESLSLEPEDLLWISFVQGKVPIVYNPDAAIQYFVRTCEDDRYISKLYSPADKDNFPSAAASFQNSSSVVAEQCDYNPSLQMYVVKEEVS